MKENVFNEFLEDVSTNMKYTFLEYASNKTELDEIAKKRGIQLPNKDLAVFKGIYGYVSKMNKNGATLNREAVEKSLETLVGKAINRDHMRQDIVGHFLDLKLVGDKLICIGVIYRGNHPEAYNLFRKLFSAEKLGLSFEAYCSREYTNDEQTEYELSNIEWSGAGLLITEEPAFDGAGVLELAKEEKELVLEFAKVMTKPEKFLTVEEASYKCSCIACGNTITSTAHCNTLKCSKCGGTMRRASRPGPGQASTENARYDMYDYSVIDKIVREAEKPKGEENNYAVIEAINFKTQIVTVRYEPTNTIGEIDLSVKPKVKITKKGKLPAIAYTEENVADYFEQDTALLLKNLLQASEDVEMIDFISEDEEDDIDTSAKLQLEKRKTIADDLFAVVVTVKDKKTGAKLKIRKYPMDTEDRVRSALRYLGMPRSQKALKKLGVSVDSVKKKILKRARKLNMKDLLERYEGSDEAIRVKMFTEIAEENATLKAQVEAKDAELVASKEDVVAKDAAIATKDTEIADVTKAKEDALSEIATRDKAVEDATIKARKEELGDSAKDMEDEDILDDSKYKIAKLEKENAALKDKVGDSDEDTKPKTASIELTKGSTDKKVGKDIWEVQKRVNDKAFKDSDTQ